MKKKGFSLAELLITLTIIGVVAALSVPPLINNIGNRLIEARVKNAYNTIAEAVDLYMTDEGLNTLRASDLDSENRNDLNRFINRYLKVAKNCESRYSSNNVDTRCFAPEISSLDKQNTSNFANFPCIASVTLVNDVSLCFHRTNLDRNAPENQAWVQSIIVDTNAGEEPNTTGRDIFALDIHPDGSIYDKTWARRRQTRDSIKKFYSRNALPMQIGYLLNNKWKIDY